LILKWSCRHALYFSVVDHSQWTDEHHSFIINYRTDQKEKIENFVDDYSSKAGIEIKDLKIERYWKEKDQMQATFFTTTDSIQAEEKTFQILRMANILATTKRNRWTFNGPHDNGQLTFSCIFNSDNTEEPLTWANIELED
jgi:hypothetical protein